MEKINCRAYWRVKRTSQGSCLTLDTHQLYLTEAKKNKEKDRIRSQRGRDPFGPYVRPVGFGSQFKNTVQAQGSMTELITKLIDLKLKSLIPDILASFEEFPAARDMTKLDFIVGFNKSDNTFGWNGFNNALQLYYVDKDEDFVSSEHVIALVPSLNPTVTFQRDVTNLLGKPFTECSLETNYTQRTCQFHEYMAKLLEVCGCYPR